jgi:hypothetical protein
MWFIQYRMTKIYGMTKMPKMQKIPNLLLFAIRDDLLTYFILLTPSFYF